MIGKLRKKLKKHFREVLEIKTSPTSIASGFAVGTFFALFPTFGLELIIIPIIIFIFKKISKISLGSAYIVWNPLITFPLYALGFKIGNSLLADVPIKTYRFEVLSQFYAYSRRFLVGNFILAVVISIVSYFAVLYLVRYFRRRKALSKTLTQANIPK